MIVIYAEKASLAKAIAAALKAGNRIAHPKEPTIGHYEFTIRILINDMPFIRWVQTAQGCTYLKHLSTL